MKRHFLNSLLAAAASLSVLAGIAACGNSSAAENQQNKPSSEIPSAPGESSVSDVYFTSDISAAGLVRIYNALPRKASGRVAVKISTGESARSHYLRPELIKDLVQEVNGTLVECNTAYGGNRMSTEKHRKAIAERGFESVAPVDIMDSEGEIQIPVRDKKHIEYDIVGSHIGNYDFMINLAHFKGHAMGGFGGVLKNQSIGVASTAGKFYIHSAGKTSRRWSTAEQDAFLESMAAAAQAVADYFEDNILYINVMNNMSVDCDCDGNPAEPKLRDIGILASTDPVALDKACLDLVFNHESSSGNDAKPLQERINRQHGTHIVDYAESIGLGSTKYTLINIDEQENTNGKMKITVGNKTFTATLADNPAAEAFAAMLPATLGMEELNGNEKYKYLDASLPSAPSCPGTIRKGDIMLYGRNCVVVFYKTFDTAYSYTPIGTIDDPDGLEAALGSGSVTVSFEK